MRIGIIGTNFISDRLYHASTLTADVDITAVFSRKRDTGAAFAAKYPGIKNVFDSFDALLASDIDAVYIASPIVAHKEQAIKALNAGKHVLCEKLMAHTLEAFLEMKKTALISGKILLEAMRPAHDPAYGTVKELLPSLGKITSATLEFCQYSSRYDRFKAGIMTNAFDPSMYNSALSDIGIYPLHTALMLFGSTPKIKAATAEILHNGFEGDGRLTLSYDGFDAEIVYSKIRDSRTPSVIHGERGSLTIDKISQPTEITLALTDTDPKVYRFAPPEDNNMTYELAAFRDMCEGKRESASYLALTEAAQRIVEEAYAITGAENYFPK